ncbi:MAG TPA: hypothetical protein VGQ28_14940, partial [Thermoanaerobaculia bacterium]|nr:hypothetical protein [Thermoanaerobaculia bacterium]
SPTLHNCRIALIQEEELSGKDLKDFGDIQFVTFGHRQWHQVREFLDCVVKARKGNPEVQRLCPEASDLYERIFRSRDATPPVQHFKTKLWTCLEDR